MKLMKKNLTALALISLLLTGCDKNSGKTTVVWWNNYQVPTLTDELTEEEARANSTYKEYYYATDLIAAFEEEHKDIEVVMDYKGSYSDIATAIVQGMNTGDTPTIASTYQDNVALYVDGEVTYDMTDFGKELESDSDFNQNYLSIEKGIYGGHYYSLPYSKSSETLVVNKTVFEKVGAGETGTSVKDKYTAPVAAESKTAYTIPTSFQEMIEVARKMKVDYPETFANQRDAKNYFTAVPFCWDSAENMFITLMEESGVGYTDGTKSTLAEKILWNTDAAKDIIVQLKKWNDEGLIATQDQLPITNEAKGYHEYSSNMVTKGKIFMCVSSTAGARYFGNDGSFSVSLNPNLTWNDSARKVISQGPSLTFFKKADEKVNEAAFTFYKYLTSSENSAKLAVTTSYFPLRNSSNNSSDVKTLTDAAGTTTDADTASAKNTDYTGQALKLNQTYSSANSYFISDAFVGSASSRTAVGDLIEEVFNAKLDTTAEDYETLVKNTVDTAFENAYKKVTA